MGLKTRKKKIDTVLQMQPPINLKQLRDFMGMVNYYKDMWPQRSHISSPLTAETGAPKKGVKAPPFKWTPEIQIVFEEMKALMAAEVLCAYPNHKKPFKIYTDASPGMTWWRHAHSCRGIKTQWPDVPGCDVVAVHTWLQCQGFARSQDAAAQWRLQRQCPQG